VPAGSAAPGPRAPVVLLPPSEGKASGGRGRPWRPGAGVLPELDAARGEVLAALGDGVGEAPTRRAIDRYTGVLYGQLDWASLPTPAKQLGSRTVLIASGLWGVSAPGDRIPAYRLKMSASLPPLGRLATWWRPRLTAALAPHLAGRLVWDLLPGEHAAAWLPADVPVRRRVTVRFLDREGRTVSHWNKLLKGSIVRWLLEGGFPDPSDLADFDHPQGYRFDPAASDLGADPAVVVLREHG